MPIFFDKLCLKFEAYTCFGQINRKLSIEKFLRNTAIIFYPSLITDKSSINFVTRASSENSRFILMIGKAMY